jgi:2-dehydro-3-deoxygalactonokinase
MRAGSLAWVLTLDGGTTNTRARLLHEGRVVSAARRAVGARDEALSSAGARPLAAAAREAIREALTVAGGVRPDAVVAAGMLSSEVGLAAVSHVAAPAGLDDLARAARPVELPEVCDHPILFVPGVRTPPGSGPDGWAEADVMRGEECETFGILQALGTPGPVALVLPGSHTKLVEVSGDDRISRSHTTLAGEMTAAVARHTLLAASLPASLPGDPDPEAVAAGARLAERDGIGRCAFLVRVAALSGALDPARRGAFWVGAAVAEDAARLARHPILSDAPRIVVGGSQPLRTLYAKRLREALTAPVVELSDEVAETASALGAAAVARLARSLRGGLSPG